MFCGWSAEFDHLPIGDETGGLSTWELLWGDHSDRAGSHPPRPRLGGSSGLVACLGVWARFARWNYGGADLVLLGWSTGGDASMVSRLRGFVGVRLAGGWSSSPPLCDSGGTKSATMEGSNETASNGSPSYRSNRASKAARSVQSRSFVLNASLCFLIASATRFEK